MGVSKLNWPPKERTIGVPKGGWQKGTYLVNVSFQTGNPIHSAILHVRFLRNGQPINEVLWNPSWEGEHRIGDLHYLEVVSLDKKLSHHLAKDF